MPDTASGRLKAYLTLDDDEFQKRLPKSMRMAERQAQRLGRQMRSIGKGLSLGLSAPIVALGAAAVKAASDAEEMASKFDAVFKGSAGTVRAWADEQAKALNRSTFALQGFLAQVQDTLVPMGIQRDTAAGLSKQITQLAVDLASFNNLAEPEVINALTSALVGNHEAVRRFGVVITQATLGQKLFEQGIAGGIKAATEQQKLLARLALIMESTSDAQGDAARTAGSFANQMRGLKAAFEEVAVSIGNTLLPLATDLIGAITPVVRRFADLDQGTREMIVILGGIAVAVGPVLVVLGALAGAVAAIGIPVAAVVAGVGVLAAGFIAFSDDLAPIGEKLLALGKAIGEIALSFAPVRLAVDALTALWDEFGDDLIAGAKVFAKGLGDAFLEIADFIIDAVGPWKQFNEAVVTLTKATFEGVYHWLVEKFEAVVGSVRDSIDAVTGFFRDMYDAVAGQSFVPEMIDRIADEFGRLDTVMVGPARGATDQVASTFEGLFRDVARNGLDAFKDMGRRLIDLFADIASQIARMLVFRPQMVTGGIGGILGGLFGATGAGASTGGIGGGSLFNIGNYISGALGTIVNGAITGLATGIATGLAFKVGTGGENLGEKIGGYVGSVLGGIIGSYYAGPLGSMIGSTLGNYVVGGLGGGFYNLASYGRLYARGMSTADRAQYAYANPWSAYAGLNMPLFGKMNLTQLNLTMGGVPGLIAGLLGVFDEKIKAALRTAPLGTTTGFEDAITALSPFGVVGLSDVLTKNFPAKATRSFVDSIVELDETLAKMLTDDQIAVVSQALQATEGRRVSQTNKFTSKKVFEVVLDRINTVFKALIGGEVGGTLFGQEIQAQLLPLAADLERSQEGIQSLVERTLEFLAQRAALVEQLDQILGEATGTISEAAQALEALDDQFEALAASAEALGVSQAKVDAAYEAARAQLIEGFAQGIQDQILAITNPWELALRELERQQEARLANAVDFGADLVEVERLNLLERERLLESYAASAKDLLLRLTAGPESPLAPTEVLAAAEAQFERLRGAVLGGDLGQLDALVAAAENLLTVSREVFASSDQFFERFRFVVATLENVTAAPGFQHGGSFTIPGGGVDNVVPIFRASGGETVSVSPRGESARQEKLLEALVSSGVESSGDRRDESRELLREIRALREIVERQQQEIMRLARRKAS